MYIRLRVLFQLDRLLHLPRPLLSVILGYGDIAPVDIPLEKNSPELTRRRLYSNILKEKNLKNGNNSYS